MGVVFGPTVIVVGIEGRVFAFSTFCTAVHAANGTSLMWSIMLSKVISPITAAGSFMGIGFCLVAFVEAEATPLLQTIFFPDLTQVSFVPLASVVVPIFEQLAPAVGVAACAWASINEDARIIRDVKIESLRIAIYLSVDLTPSPGLTLLKLCQEWRINIR
ncbi:MAG: hypothetical protein NTY21_00095 [Actinobacteria bacterium]|nr:hypothetical protein [Actinomycetota bacterium]